MRDNRSVSAPDARLQGREGESAPRRRSTIAILDYGSQYTQLIARRVRESRVYCEIFPHDVTADELAARDVAGVILSGGPASVYEKGAPLVDPRVLDGRFPVLGICYGMHLMAHALGGELQRFSAWCYRRRRDGYGAQRQHRRVGRN